MPNRPASASVSGEMFARIRAASTWSPESDRRTEAAAPPVAASAVVERLPFGVPGAGSAFVLLHDALQQDPRVRARVTRAGDREHRADRVVLVRHRRGAATGPLGHLAHLGLREQHDVTADLRGRTRRAGERAGQLCDRRPDRVPRDDRLAEAELGGVEPQHLRAVVAERGQCSRSAAELSRQRATRPQRGEPSSRRGPPASRPP